MKLYSDSSAAKGIVSRTGVGKIRHLDTKYLWIQNAVKKKQIEMRKVCGKVNPADIGTKFLSASEMRPLLEKIGLFFVNEN